MGGHRRRASFGVSSICAPVLIQLAHEHNSRHRVSFENAKSAREIVRLRAVPQVGNRKLRVRYSLR